MELTKEQGYKYYKNKRKATEYFNLQKGGVLHHKDVTLKHKDFERYLEWRPEDLVPMTKSEHTRLHMRLHCNLPEDRWGEKNPFYGKHHTEESREKIKKANHAGEHNGMYGRGDIHIGRHWFNNGIECVFTRECPEGFVPGRLKLNWKNKNA